MHLFGFGFLGAAVLLIPPAVSMSTKGKNLKTQQIGTLPPGDYLRPPTLREEIH